MLKIDNSVVLFFAWKAAKLFGGRDSLFNSAGFATVIQEVLGLPLLDGLVVKLILSGRSGIEQVGDAHWRVFY